ncbi:MAG: type II secretion system F family protein [bacterium]|nr:type II secretion system F family protein [bacterium]
MKDKKILSNEEIASFCSQFAMLFQAGIPPVESINIMLTDVKSTGGRELLTQILEVCQQGEPLYKALESTGVFPDYVIHMLTLGEESGNLEACMLSLAAYYEKEQGISESIRGAVTYPCIMIAMMVLVIFVLVSRVMPIFNQVFIELGSEMSGFSASLLKLGSSLNRYSVVFLVLVCVLAALYLFTSKTAPGKRLAAKFLSVFPLTRRFYESVACERFASGMALTLSSGMDIFSGLDMVSPLVGSREMQEKIAVCRESLQGGDNFAEALSSSRIFNNLHSQMVAVGFKSGNIDAVLNKIADSYEKETNRRIQAIISVLEPTLVIILSVIVGLILLSVILPLMGIMTSIG